MRVLIFTAAILALPGFSAAQDSEDYARMSRASWAAFECAGLASVLELHQEQERLFNFGFDQGKLFVQSVQAGRVRREDLNSISPSGFLLAAEGPNADFILGRVFAASQENALKDVITSETILEKELQKSIASRKYREGNCEVLGRVR